MSRVRRAVDGWVALWAGEEPPHAMAMVRIAVGLVAVWDFASVASLGLVEELWAPTEAGGLVDLLQRTPVPPVYRWLPATPATAWGLWALALGSALTLLAGLFSRASAVVLMLVWAQLALITPNTDRGIDMMLRNVLLILAFSGSGRLWSVDAWWARRSPGRAPAGEAAGTIPAWPRRLLLLQIVVMYFAAGVQKVGSVWLPVGSFSAIYVVLHDPMVARFAPDFAARFWRATQLGTIGTLVFEWGAPLILLFHWYRHTRTRPGRLRALFNRLEIGRVFVGLGVALHLGIALTMNIGIFPWAMLGLYPAFFHPEELCTFWRRKTR